MHETIFPETHEECEKKSWEKLSEKSAKKRFLYSNEYRDLKTGYKKMHETIFPETHE